MSAKDSQAIESMSVSAGGMRFSCLCCGSGGALVLCLHGFPDDAHSMAGFLRALAVQGFTAVAPYMRGYSPTTPAPDGSYDVATLGEDAIELAGALGFDTAFVVGHDWGAAAAYAAATIAPGTISAIATIAVPPLAAVLRGLARFPAQLRRSWYIGRFQLPGAVALLRRHDFALVDRLWRDWSPTWDGTCEHLDRVKQTFHSGRTAEAAVSYYRQLLPRFGRLAAYRRAYAIAMRPPGVPTLMIAGAQDGCIGPELFRDACVGVSAHCRVEVVQGAGHFAHLERPEVVEPIVIEFLQQHIRSTR